MKYGIKANSLIDSFVSIVAKFIQQKLFVEIMESIFALAISAGYFALIFQFLAPWFSRSEVSFTTTSTIGPKLLFGLLMSLGNSLLIGILLILVFAVQLGWLPASGRGQTREAFGIAWSWLTLDGLQHLLLPAFNLALFKLSLLIRLTRAQTREALLQDYVRFARAKGLRARRVVGVHVLKNILIPIVTVIGLEFGSVIAFAIVTESIFAWPGTGKLLIDSINQLDRPVIVAYLLVIVTLFVSINLLVDLLYTALDPRVRSGARQGATA